MNLLRALLPFALVACVGDDVTAIPADGGNQDAGSDAGSDAGLLRCTGPDFGAPTAISGIANGDSVDLDLWVSDTGTALFASSRTGGVGSTDIYAGSLRGETVSGVALVATINSGAAEYRPMLSPDSLSIYFTRFVGSAFQLWTARRTTVTGIFQAPQQVANARSVACPSLTPSGASIYFSDMGSGGKARTYVQSLETPGVPPAELTEFGDTFRCPVPNASGAELFLRELLANGKERTVRSTRKNGGWSTPEVIPALDGLENATPSALSSDGCELYLTGTENGRVAPFVSRRKK